MVKRRGLRQTDVTANSVLHVSGLSRGYGLTTQMLAITILERIDRWRHSVERGGGYESQAGTAGDHPRARRVPDRGGAGHRRRQPDGTAPAPLLCHAGRGAA